MSMIREFLETLVAEQKKKPGKFFTSRELTAVMPEYLGISSDLGDLFQSGAVDRLQTDNPIGFMYRLKASVLKKIDPVGSLHEMYRAHRRARNGNGKPAPARTIVTIDSLLEKYSAKIDELNIVLDQIKELAGSEDTAQAILDKAFKNKVTRQS